MKVLKAVCLAGAAAFALSSLAEESSWQRPRTTRRYLHPPLAQNMFTLWNDGKIIRGDVAHHHDWSDRYADLKSDVLWIMHGEKDEPFDFKNAQNRLPEDGTPFHGLTWKKDGFSRRLTNVATQRISPNCRLFQRTVAPSLRETGTFPIAVTAASHYNR